MAGAHEAGKSTAQSPARSREALGVQLGPALRPARQEPHERLADLDVAAATPRGSSRSRERRRLRLRLVGSQLQLASRSSSPSREQLVDPVARRVHLEPVAGVRRDERPPAAVLLDAQVPLRRRASSTVLELVVVERDAEVVDAAASASDPAGRRR